MSTQKKTNKKKNTSVDKRTAKKAAVLGTDKKSRFPLFMIIGVSAALITGGVFFFASRKGVEEPVAATSVVADASKAQVVYPVSMFQDGKAQHFEYEGKDGMKIRYFILKSADGIIRAAFDACDVCWPANKGYYQAGDRMVCRNCGREFASVLVNEVKGGCNPAPLHRQIVNNELVIRTEDILEGRQYFDFSRRS